MRNHIKLEIGSVFFYQISKPGVRKVRIMRNHVKLEIGSFAVNFNSRGFSLWVPDRFAQGSVRAGWLILAQKDEPLRQPIGVSFMQFRISSTGLRGR